MTIKKTPIKKEIPIIKKDESKFIHPQINKIKNFKEIEILSTKYEVNWIYIRQKLRNIKIQNKPILEKYWLIYCNWWNKKVNKK